MGQINQISPKYCFKSVNDWNSYPVSPNTTDAQSRKSGILIQYENELYNLSYVNTP